jgi:hypothetical protein
VSNAGPRLLSLKILNLSRNAIASIAPKSFSRMENLVELDLSSNQLEDLDTLSDMPSLERLSLRANRLRVLTGLEGLPRLTTLDLSHNELEDVVRLYELSSLKALDLSGNALNDLDEMRDICMCLNQLKDLRLTGNPLSEVRNYRMRILDNRAITKLDNYRVSRNSRRQWSVETIKSNLDDIVEETTTQYVQWIEREAKEMQDAINILRRREEEIEKAYDSYRLTMETELEQTIRYIQEIANNQETGIDDPSFLTTLEGQKEWHAFLQKMDSARKAAYTSKASNLEAKLEDSVALKTDTESYLEKLDALSKERPSVWRELKLKEAAYRRREEDLENVEQKEFERERAAARKKLVDRATERNQILLASANQMQAKLRDEEPLKKSKNKFEIS